MDSKRFYAIAKRVSEHTAVDEDDIFSPSRMQPISDAKHLLFYIASREGFTNGYIQRFTTLRGLDIHHSSIKHGIDKVDRMIKSDNIWKEMTTSLLCGA
tara:strand:- start:41 stop:337 length:297 start_codon:yes stop_codon:yes gene_type:complete